MSRPASKSFLKALRASDRKRVEAERAVAPPPPPAPARKASYASKAERGVAPPPPPAPARKASYASEVMLRVSWSCLNHADGQPQHCRRGEVMLDLGLEQVPDPELTGEEMQRIAFAAKMAALKVLSARKRGGR